MHFWSNELDVFNIRNPINGIYNNVDLLLNGLKTREDSITKFTDPVEVEELNTQLALDREAVDAIGILSFTIYIIYFFDQLH